MFPLITTPETISEYLSNVQDVFCREEGFDWVNRSVTGLLISPNKTVQGIYDLLVFPTQEQKPSRRAMHQALFENGWSSDRLITRHHEVIAPDYRGTGRVVISFDWTHAHHERGDRIDVVKKRYDYVEHRQSRYQKVLRAVVSNRERFDGLDAIVQPPSFEREEKAYLEATSKASYPTVNEAIQRVTELLAYDLHRKTYKKHTEMFVEMVQRFEKEGRFPDAVYVFDHGVLSRPVTKEIEAHGKLWLSDFEKSRNIFWQGMWRRVDVVNAQLCQGHPQAFRRYTVSLRNGKTKTYWAFRTVGRVKKYGKKRLFIIHDKEDLTDEPQYLITNALHWEATRAIQTWSSRWTSEIFHEFGKQCTGFEDAQVRNEEAVPRHFRLNCVAQSILQRVHTEGSTSEKFAFADGAVTCGQSLKAIGREVFHPVLTFAKQLFEEGLSCDKVLEMLMPA